MEAKLALILAACMLLSFSNKGDAQPCAPSDLVVTQIAMPGRFRGHPHYLVTVENKCVCTQLGVKLACAGFDSSVSVDPAAVIASNGGNDLCTLIGGQPMHANETVLFTYASSTKISFTPVSSSTLACSIAPSMAPSPAPQAA